MNDAKTRNNYDIYRCTLYISSLQFSIEMPDFDVVLNV